VIINVVLTRASVIFWCDQCCFDARVCDFQCMTIVVHVFMWAYLTLRSITYAYVYVYLCVYLCSVSTSDVVGAIASGIGCVDVGYARVFPLVLSLCRAHCTTPAT
jgi:hypothetical protein